MPTILLADTSLQSLDWFKIIINLAGGLAIFLLGMGVMTDGLKSAAGDGLRKMLAKLTTNRFMGTVSGVVITGLTQSSTVTTVLLVGFASAGLISMSQSIGVILGSNIGSTFTAQIIAFNIDRYVPMMIAVGFFTQMLSRHVRIRSLGTMMLGLGLVFLGMMFMSEATHPLRGHPTFIHLMSGMDNPVWGVLIGAMVTAIIQSSAATTAMVIVLAGQGAITLEAGIALAFGANIGTCLTALLASFGKPRVAKQVAIVHVLFNVFGVLIWIAFIPQFAEIVRDISPTKPDLQGAARFAAEAPRQIANAHTLFNIINALLVLPLITPLAWLVTRIIPDRPSIETPIAVPKYLNRDALDTPSLALDYARLELSRLGERIARMFRAAPQLIGSHAVEASKALTRNRAEVDTLYDHVLAYLSKVSRKELPEELRLRSEALLAIASHFSSLAEIIADDLAAAVAGMNKQNVVVSEQTKSLLWSLHDVTQSAVDQTVDALQACDVGLAEQVIQMKADIYSQAEELNHHLANRLGADAPGRAQLYRMESEVRGQIKRVYYVSRRIAKHIRDLD